MRQARSRQPSDETAEATSEEKLIPAERRHRRGGHWQRVYVRVPPRIGAQDGAPDHHCNLIRANFDIMTFVDAMRKIYQPLGFSKGYNFPLCECREHDALTQHPL